MTTAELLCAARAAKPAAAALSAAEKNRLLDAMAQALLDHTDLPADQVVKKALEIAGELCIYTNMHHTVETL